MTRKEAIEVLRKLPIGLMDLSYEEKGDLTEALNIALAALRGPTREQVEAWRGEWVRETTPELLKKTVISHCSRCWYHVYRLEEHTKFCPVCGAPMTDEAVEITLRRLEALKDGTI